MTKRRDLDAHHPTLGGHSARELISKRPFLARCSGLLAEHDLPLLGRCSGLSAESEMTKWPFLGGCSGAAAKRPVQQQKGKYLHLVLNDWDRGYSIYRVGEEDFDADADLDVPRPAASPLVRIVAQHARSWFFASHGTKIMAMHPAESSPGIPVFDTETLGMTVCPCPLSHGNCGSKPLYATVGGKLLAFLYPFVEVLGPEPPPTEESWSWTSIKPMPPFDSIFIRSYAVHPDGHTIFVSVSGYKLNPGLSLPHGDRNSTFTFDMETHKWTHIGDWLLPFKGQAYYDHELDAWVGLCFYKNGAGHTCCCDIPPATGCVTMPVWKLGVDLFFEWNSKRHLGATLVYMDNSRFCLVESWMPKDDDFYPRLRLVKMSSFLLKYGKDGELRVSGRCTYASMAYQIPHEHTDVVLDPVAFSM